MKLPINLLRQSHCQLIFRFWLIYQIILNIFSLTKCYKHFFRKKKKNTKTTKPNEIQNEKQLRCYYSDKVFQTKNHVRLICLRKKKDTNLVYTEALFRNH
jgi:hypothetical protein